MSHQLPEHPNLDHLKDQAKRLLDDRRLQDPTAQLANALHDTARQYGFQTWPALKAHVESLPPQVPWTMFAGLWAVNVGQSKLHPASRFQNATMEFSVSGDAVTIKTVVVEESGKQVQGTNTVLVDGQNRQTPEGGPYALVAKWILPRAFETIATKDGAVVGHGTYEVSADGATLTISSKNAKENAEGWASDTDQVIVLQRA